MTEQITGQSEYKTLYEGHSIQAKEIPHYMSFLFRKGTEYQQAYTRIYMKYAFTKILISFGFRESALYKINNLLKEAEKYHEHHICEDLYYIKAYMEVDGGVSTEKYLSIALKHSKVNQAEIKSRILYTTLLKRVSFNQISSSDQVRESTEIINELESAALEKASPKIVIWIFDLKYLKAIILNDYDEAIKSGHEALNYFRDLPYDHRSHKLHIIYRLLSLKTSARKYPECHLLITEGFKYLQTNSRNWFWFHVNRSKLALHERRYDDGLTILKDMKSNGYFHLMPPAEMSRYQLTLDYLNIAIGKPRRVSEKITREKIGPYFKDKSGVYLSFVMCRAFYWAMYDRDRLIDREKTTLKYAKSYVDQQSKEYIMLKYLVKSFKNDKIIDIDKFRYSSDEVEIMPFEHMMEMVRDENAVHHRA